MRRSCSVLWSDCVIVSPPRRETRQARPRRGLRAAGLTSSRPATKLFGYVGFVLDRSDLAQLGSQAGRSYVGEGSDLTDEMGLIVVPGLRSEPGPGNRGGLLHRGKGSPEPDHPSEALGRDADGIAKVAFQVPPAQADDLLELPDE